VQISIHIVHPSLHAVIIGFPFVCILTTQPRNDAAASKQLYEFFVIACIEDVNEVSLVCRALGMCNSCLYRSGTMRLGTGSRLIQMRKVRRKKYRLRHGTQSPFLVHHIFVTDVVRRVTVLTYSTDNLLGDSIGGFGEDDTGTGQLLISRCSGY